MYIQDLFNPNQKKKLKGNKLVDNSKNLNSVNLSLSLTSKSLSEALLFAEHVVYKNCSECQKQLLHTTCSPQV